MGKRPPVVVLDVEGSDADAFLPLSDQEAAGQGGVMAAPSDSADGVAGEAPAHERPRLVDLDTPESDDERTGRSVGGRITWSGPKLLNNFRTWSLEMAQAGLVRVAVVAHSETTQVSGSYPHQQ